MTKMISTCACLYLTLCSFICWAQALGGGGGPHKGAWNNVARGWEPARAQVYMWSPLGGVWSSWDNFNEVWSGFTDPEHPEMGASWVYFFTQQARLLTLMQPDGYVFSTPHVPDFREAGDDIWRMRAEWSLDAVRHHAPPGMYSKSGIRDGLKLLRHRFPGEIVLYSACPDVLRDPALATDYWWMEGYVKANLHSFLMATDEDGKPIVNAVIVDAAGDITTNPSDQARAVMKFYLVTIHRLYPWLVLGSEPHAQNDEHYFPFACSLTMSSFADTQIDVDWRLPWAPMRGPVIVADGNGGTPANLPKITEWLTKGYSVAVPAWQWGFDSNVPTAENTTRWNDVMLMAHDIQRGFRAADVPPSGPVPAGPLPTGP